MGRKKRLFPVGSLKLHCPLNVDANKKYSIYYVYNWNGEKIQRQTGYSAKLSDWNPQKSLLLRSYGSEYTRVNNVLANKQKDYDSLIEKYVLEHPDRLTVQVIRDILDGKEITRKDRGLDFCKFVIDYLQEECKKNRLSWSRTKNGISCMNGFRQFLQFKQKGTYKKDSIYLGEISPQLINEYIDFRKEYKHNKDATINHALTPIIKACRYAAALDFIDPKIVHLIAQSRIVERDDYNSTREDFDGRFLSVEQLGELVRYIKEDRCHTYRQREYITLFLFAFHACGLRVSDVITLRWRDIDFSKKTIRKIQIKTRQKNTIPLTQGAEAILNDWKNSHDQTEFVFGLLPDGFDLNDSETLYVKRNSATAGINQSLTAVGKNIGFPFPLTFHRARHSFAMYALNEKKMPMSKVSQLLGHQSTEVTERIYANYLPETLAEDLSDLTTDIPIPTL